MRIIRWPLRGEILILNFYVIFEILLHHFLWQILTFTGKHGISN